MEMESNKYLPSNETSTINKVNKIKLNTDESKEILIQREESNLPEQKYLTIAEKLSAAHPYNYFLTAINSSPQTHSEPLTVAFRELLDPSLGELECSIQINFMINIDWLLRNYEAAGQLDKPLIVIYGADTPELKTISKKYRNVSSHYIRMNNAFAKHHTKMMLFGYRDKSMRVVVSTANLIRADWHNITQGLWISPRLLPIPDGEDSANGDSSTEFRNDLLKYLRSYNLPKLQEWLIRIRKTNFKPINVFLVTSIPGTHAETYNGGYSHGLGRVAWLLSHHSAPIDDSVPIVAQCSSIGSLGASSDAWLLTEFLNSVRRDFKPTGLRKRPPFQLIYPSVTNVIQSHDGRLGAGCLPYGSDTHKKQQWLTAFMYQWKASERFRSQAMPHIKTYSRWMNKKLYWFILTSANLSKAAWGSFNKAKKNGISLRVNNYEAGVMFFPKCITGTDYFSLDVNDKTTPVFPTVYDMPLVKYTITDQPWLSDIMSGR